MKTKQVSTTKTELRKKKELMETKPTKLCKQRAPLKADLLIELTKLQERYDSLEDKYKKLLKESTNSTSECNDSKHLVDGESQTKSEDLVFCYECEFPAEDFHKLGEHMLEHHFNSNCQTCDEIFTTKEKLADHVMEDHNKEGLSQKSKIERINCNFCEKVFETTSDLMKHKKQHHGEKVSICWNFSIGTCEFSDHLCWFRYSTPIPSCNMKCKVCDDTFATEPEIHRHMKQNHKSLVHPCKNERNGECKYKMVQPRTKWRK